MKGTRELKYYKGIKQLFNTQEISNRGSKVLKDMLKKKRKMADINLTLSVIILKVNRLNVPPHNRIGRTD